MTQNISNISGVFFFQVHFCCWDINVKLRMIQANVSFYNKYYKYKNKIEIFLQCKWFYESNNYSNPQYRWWNFFRQKIRSLNSIVVTKTSPHWSAVRNSSQSGAPLETRSDKTPENNKTQLLIPYLEPRFCFLLTSPDPMLFLELRRVCGP